MIARDIPSTIQIVFENATGPYAEAVRRSGILEIVDQGKTYYTFLLPEDVGMSAKAFLSRKDLLKVIKYHILIGPVNDQPGESPYDRLARGEAIRERTLLGSTVTLTQRGPSNLKQTFVNGIQLGSSPGDVSSYGNGNIISVETLIPFPKNMRK